MLGSGRTYKRNEGEKIVKMVGGEKKGSKHTGRRDSRGREIRSTRGKGAPARTPPRYEP